MQEPVLELELVREQELEQVLGRVLVQEPELVQEQARERELHTQPGCLPVSLLILKQILVFCSIYPPFVKF